MLCVSPSASRYHEKMGQKTADEAAQHMAKSMEMAMEMTSHMHTRCLCMATCFTAEDSKYKFWHHIYSTMEMAAKKHYKGDCCTVFNQIRFECMMHSQDEIRQNKMMSWPVSANAECCPMAMCDMCCCCISAMCHMMKEAAPETMKGRHQKYHVTGMDMVSPQVMMDMMSRSLNMPVKYNQVSQDEWKGMMQERMCPLEMCCYMEVFQMMEDGKLKKCTDLCKKLTGKEPMRIDKWMKDHEADFKM